MIRIEVLYVCTNKGATIEMQCRTNSAKHHTFLEACSPCRPRATEPQWKRETRSVLYHALVVNSMFEQSENVAIAVASEFEQLPLTCIEGYDRFYAK